MQCETAGPAFLRGLVREKRTTYPPERRRYPQSITPAAENGGGWAGQCGGSHWNTGGRAGRLYISEKTASVHVSNIMAKLEAANRTEAGAKARALGLDRL